MRPEKPHGVAVLGSAPCAGRVRDHRRGRFPGARHVDESKARQRAAPVVSSEEVRRGAVAIPHADRVAEREVVDDLRHGRRGRLRRRGLRMGGAGRWTARRRAAADSGSENENEHEHEDRKPNAGRRRPVPEATASQDSRHIGAHRGPRQAALSGSAPATYHRRHRAERRQTEPGGPPGCDPARTATTQPRHDKTPPSVRLAGRDPLFARRRASQPSALSARRKPRRGRCRGGCPACSVRRSIAVRRLVPLDEERGARLRAALYRYRLSRGNVHDPPAVVGTW